MNREEKKLLQDILTSIKNIIEIRKPIKNYSVYQKSILYRSAMERQLAIIGEAVVQLKNIKSKIEIENSRQIINIRNRLIHAYDSVNDELIWGIIVRHIPELKKEVSELLKK